MRWLVVVEAVLGLSIFFIDEKLEIWVTFDRGPT